MRHFWWAVLATCWSACSTKQAPDPLRVLAAASCADVAEELCNAFPDGPVQLQIGATSVLARQILDSAPADLLISASTEWKDKLVRADLVAGTPLQFATGRMVCIAPQTSKGPLPKNLSELHNLLSNGARLAIADPAVPAGQYARQALKNSGRLKALEPHLVGLANVRHVYRAVAQGQAAAGFVYATDAHLPGVQTLFELDPTLTGPIEYWPSRSAPPAPNPI